MERTREQDDAFFACLNGMDKVYASGISEVIALPAIYDMHVQEGPMWMRKLLSRIAGRRLERGDGDRLGDGDCLGDASRLLDDRFGDDGRGDAVTLTVATQLADATASQHLTAGSVTAMPSTTMWRSSGTFS